MKTNIYLVLFWANEGVRVTFMAVFSSAASHMIADGMAGDHITRGGFHTFSFCACVCA